MSCYFAASVGHIDILLVTVSKIIILKKSLEATKYLILPYHLLSAQLLEAAKSELCTRAERTKIESLQRNSDVRSLPATTAEYPNPRIDNIRRVGMCLPS